MTSSVESRLLVLEDRVGGVPGTILSRCLNPDGSGVIWCLSVGRISSAKTFFYGKTIDEVIGLAETALGSIS